VCKEERCLTIIAVLAQVITAHVSKVTAQEAEVTSAAGEGITATVGGAIMVVRGLSPDDVNASP